MMKVLVDYPSEEEEFVIVERVTGDAGDVSAVASTEPARRAAARMPQGLRRPVADAVRGQARQRDAPARTRYELADIAKYLTFGASPRATIGLIEGARALAFLRGRSYALPEDVIDLVADVLRHRLVLSYEALADGLDADADRAARDEARSRCPTSRWRPSNGRWPQPMRRSAATEQRRGAAAPARMDRDPPPRRPAAGRLPHAVARRRARPRRPARVPAPRRRPPHRLERDRAAAAAVCAPVHRGPRDHRLVPARPVGAASTSARTDAPSAPSRASSSPCSRAC